MPTGIHYAPPVVVVELVVELVELVELVDVVVLVVELVELVEDVELVVLDVVLVEVVEVLEVQVNADSKFVNSGIVFYPHSSVTIIVAPPVVLRA